MKKQNEFNMSEFRTNTEILAECYCRPESEEEWKLLGFHPHNPQKNPFVFHTGKRLRQISRPIEDNAKVLPVQSFLDLINDVPTPDRLKDAGFTIDKKKHYNLWLGDKFGGHNLDVVLLFPDFPVVDLSEEPTNCKTMADIHQLITLLKEKK